MNLIRPIYAQVTNPLLPLSQTSASQPLVALTKIIQTAISLFLMVGVLYFIWYMFMGGYHWIDSEGDPKKIEAAKNQLLYSVIGLGVCFSIFAILKVIGYVFGIPGLGTLELSWPTL